jgi:hypothetical protein
MILEPGLAVVEYSDVWKALLVEGGLQFGVRSAVKHQLARLDCQNADLEAITHIGVDVMAADESHGVWKALGIHEE